MSTLQHLKLSSASLKFTADLTDFEVSSLLRQRLILGQDRAQSALEFGIAMPNPGYHIFVMGESGLGRLSMISNHLETLTKESPAPSSYAYVDNFANSREPLAIKLPAGVGHVFTQAIDKLFDNLLATFPAAFESPMYQQKKTAIERQFSQAYNNALDLVENRAQSQQIALFRDKENISFAPIQGNKALNEEQFAGLTQAEREAFHKHVEELEDYLSDVLLELPQWRRAMVDKIRQLDNETICQAIEPLFAELTANYQSVDSVIVYLSAMKRHLYSTIIDYFMPGRATESVSNSSKRLMLVEQYAPNILVENRPEQGAPVIYEAHPIYPNLFGRIEYINDQGTLVTNYQRICAGSLHKANGGYLILDADKLLNYPFVWEGLKRALKSGYIEIESPYFEQGINTITLKPELIPLNIKVILVGSPDIYYLLEELDSEFNEMFKILADFDHYIPRNQDTTLQFVQLMNQTTSEHHIQLTQQALEGLIEYSCRLAENQYQFSARISDVLDIISEAALFCRQENVDIVDRKHIEQALTAREYRNGRLSQTILEDMLDGTILIDTEGEAIGKINGLTILAVGGSSFGAPARITTTVYPGSRGIIDIEREAELGQSIHSKGVMILTGYLGHFYAQQFPLAISASIAIEQSYSAIDGDSASLAELCCLISALTRTPIKQSFAVTGSINQYGEVQAIGGINEKIEGYFRLCKARGLNGQHAVIIPDANKRNLMLKQEVLDAVEQGLFAVYAVVNVDQTLELLTGEPAGILDEQGLYPEGSINAKAISRLKEISDMAVDEDKEESGDN